MNPRRRLRSGPCSLMVTWQHDFPLLLQLPRLLPPRRRQHWPSDCSRQLRWRIPRGTLVPASCLKAGAAAESGRRIWMHLEDPHEMMAWIWTNLVGLWHRCWLWIWDLAVVVDLTRWKPQLQKKIISVSKMISLLSNQAIYLNVSAYGSCSYPFDEILQNRDILKGVLQKFVLVPKI